MRYYDIVNAAYQSADASELRRTTVPSVCWGCRAQISVVEGWRKAGRHVRGGAFSVRLREVAVLGPQSGYVELSLRYGGAPVVDASGRVVDRVPSASWAERVGVQRVGATWVVTDVQQV
jgi:hypothetical protein